ncbi:MAG: ester cyclase [Caldilineaceae bacterium]
MSTAKTAAERYINAMNTGTLDDLAEFVAPDFEQIFYGFPTVQGLEGANAYITMLRAAYPDLVQTIDDLVADGNKVAFHGTLRGTQLGPLRTVAPSGNQIELPYLALAHTVAGKLTRIWIAADKLDYLQQLGVLPRSG